MMKKQEKKRLLLRQILSIAVFLLVGAAFGFLLGKQIGSAAKGLSFGETMLQTGLLLLGFYLLLLLQIILHEAGHLVFGLRSGYGFSSFRVGSLMWVNERGRLRLRRLTIAGTGGQCLMSPPPLVDGKMPFIRYNLGGPLMSLISGLVFLGLYFLFRELPYLSVLLLVAGLIGLFFALVNGIPMQLGAVDNDGYNALSLSKSPAALRAFWIQLKVNENISKGLLLKDMPDEWFELPGEEEMKNSMTAVLAVFAANRLMDAHKFRETRALIDRLLSADTAIMGLHRSLLACDAIFCELVCENRKTELDAMLDKPQKRFMKQMRTFPSVARTEYAYALLAEKNKRRAEELEKKFEQYARKYPYPKEIENERRLVRVAKESAGVPLG